MTMWALAGLSANTGINLWTSAMQACEVIFQWHMKIPFLAFYLMIPFLRYQHLLRLNGGN